jgi:hypothetical protein
MSTTIYRKEVSDYIENLIKENEIKLDGAVNFNSFEKKDQNAILEVYRIKANKGELKADISDKIACIEEVANLYRAQKCAFQDVVTKEGFEAVSDIPKSYGGRIAILTNHGTFIVLGKYKRQGRHISMNRIHTPAYNYDKQRGYLAEDLELGKYPHLKTISVPSYRGSAARALAINPNGADDDEIEEADVHKTAIMMGMRTAFFLVNPQRELIGVQDDE